MTSLIHEVKAEQRCPFVPALVLYGITVLASAVVFVALPRSTEARGAIIGPAVAAGIAAPVIEIRRLQLASCPWLDIGVTKRLALYILLFVVGDFVVLPGVLPTPDVHWVFRLPFAMLVISGVALLRLHTAVDHSELEETGVSRGIYVASRLPVYCVVVSLVVVVLVGAVELLMQFIGAGS